MFRDRTEPMLFRAGTVPETVPVRSLKTNVFNNDDTTHNMRFSTYDWLVGKLTSPFSTTIGYMIGDNVLVEI